MKYTADSPYGYWISRDDIIPVIQEECHIESACEILEQKYGRTTKGCKQIYRTMFHLGYMRVVNFSKGGYGCQYRIGQQLSKLQKQFIADADYVEKTGYKP